VEARGAVVVGGYVNGLGLVRALAARGITTAVVNTKAFDFAHRSRWVSASDAAHDVDETPERLAELLERRWREWGGWALIPANDEALAALALHHERLSSKFRVLAPEHELARYFLDKELMNELAATMGVQQPRCFGPAVEETASSPDLVYPVVVKPSVSYLFTPRFGRKLFVARDRGELLEATRRMRTAGIRGQVFDLVPGGDDRIHAYCTYLDARGEPRGGVTMRKLRQSPARFGVARVAEVVADPPGIREATIELLRRLGYRGIAQAEFKLDPRDGTFRFLEVNGRSPIYNALLRRAGLDGAALAWSDQVCNSSESARVTLWPGVWIHLHTDLLNAAVHGRREGLSFRTFAAPYRRPKIYAVWSAADPLPFLTQWARTAMDAARLVTGASPADDRT
jgi:predicted ATP-grasp superfamily ATP-dependent carboligase